MEARPPLHPPVRLVQQWLPVSDHPQISHVGMSDLSNRGEVRSHGSDALSAVTDVTGDYIDAFQGQPTSLLTARSADDLVRSTFQSIDTASTKITMKAEG